MTDPVPITGLAFAVVGDDVSVVGLDFYGDAVELTAVGPLALAFVPGREPPAATEEVVWAYHDVVADLAAAGGCLPHRFGTLVDLDRARRDLEVNHDVLSTAVARTKGCGEIVIRGRVDPARSVEALAHFDGDVPRHPDALEVGRLVHARVAEMLARHSADSVAALGDQGHTAFATVHDDGLGVDLVVVTEGDAATEFEPQIESLTTYCDMEGFEPTPCYRYAAQVLTGLSNV